MYIKERRGIDDCVLVDHANNYPNDAQALATESTYTYILLYLYINIYVCMYMYGYYMYLDKFDYIKDTYMYIWQIKLKCI